MSLPIAVLPVTCLLAGVALLGDTVPLAVAFVAIGLVFLAIWVVLTRRSIAKVQAARTDGQVAAALDEPIVEMSLVWAGLLLIVGLVALVCAHPRASGRCSAGAGARVERDVRPQA